MKLGLVEQILTTSSLENKKTVAKFLEQFNVDLTTDDDTFTIIGTDGGIYHEIPLSSLAENDVTEITEAVLLCLNDCNYHEDDDPSWVNTIESMKYFLN